MKIAFLIVGMLYVAVEWVSAKLPIPEGLVSVS
jgi:hypothetical protein